MAIMSYRLTKLIKTPQQGSFWLWSSPRQDLKRRRQVLWSTTKSACLAGASWNHHNRRKSGSLFLAWGLCGHRLWRMGHFFWISNSDASYGSVPWHAWPGLTRFHPGLIETVESWVRTSVCLLSISRPLRARLRSHTNNSRLQLIAIFAFWQPILIV